MLTQEQINEDWTVRSDNYNNYVEEEFATNRPEKWLELIESQAPAEVFSLCCCQRPVIT